MAEAIPSNAPWFIDFFPHSGRRVCQLSTHPFGIGFPSRRSLIHAR
jgi:hypothetical protein